MSVLPFEYKMPYDEGASVVPLFNRGVSPVMFLACHVKNYLGPKSCNVLHRSFWVLENISMPLTVSLSTIVFWRILMTRFSRLKVSGKR